MFTFTVKNSQNVVWQVSQSWNPCFHVLFTIRVKNSPNVLWQLSQSRNACFVYNSRQKFAKRVVTSVTTFRVSFSPNIQEKRFLIYNQQQNRHQKCDYCHVTFHEFLTQSTTKSPFKTNVTTVARHFTNFWHNQQQNNNCHTTIFEFLTHFNNKTTNSAI